MRVRSARLAALARAALLFPLALPLLAMKCSENPVEEALSDDDDTLITIVKTNLDTEAVHIFARFESFPCCRVASGVPDRSSTVLARSGENVQFTAGRRSALIQGAAVTCRVTDEALDAGEATVEFGIDQRLRCRDW